MNPCVCLSFSSAVLIGVSPIYWLVVSSVVSEVAPARTNSRRWLNPRASIDSYAIDVNDTSSDSTSDGSPRLDSHALRTHDTFSSSSSSDASEQDSPETVHNESENMSVDNPYHDLKIKTARVSDDPQMSPPAVQSQIPAAYSSQYIAYRRAGAAFWNSLGHSLGNPHNDAIPLSSDWIAIPNDGNVQVPTFLQALCEPGGLMNTIDQAENHDLSYPFSKICFGTYKRVFQMSPKRVKSADGTIRHFSYTNWVSSKLVNIMFCCFETLMG